MTYLALNLDDTQEQKAVEKGGYELQITSAQLVETGENSKNPGKPMYKITLGFTDLDLNAPVITHYMTLPFEGDEHTYLKLIGLKRFLHAFQIPYSTDGIDLDGLAFEMLGKTAFLEVDLTTPNENGDVYNRIKVPRLREENETGRGKPPRKRRSE